MIKLSKEQIEQAAKAACDRFNFRSIEQGMHWDAYSEGCRNDWRDRVEAAAPYLQSEWEMPTPRELVQAYDVFRATNQLPATGWRSSEFLPNISAVLRNFVHDRNAALVPNPVDTKREKIINAVKNHVTAEQIADAILALDEPDK